MKHCLVLLLALLLASCNQPETIVVIATPTPVAARPVAPTPTPVPTPVSTSTPISVDNFIEWWEAGDHIGEEYTVCGPVVRATYRADVNGSPTFIDLGAAYPDPERLTVVIWGDDRDRFPYDPEAHLTGDICIEGLIDSYRGVVQIEAYGPEQFK